MYVVVSMWLHRNAHGYGGDSRSQIKENMKLSSNVNLPYALEPLVIIEDWMFSRHGCYVEGPFGKDSWAGRLNHAVKTRKSRLRD